MKIEMFWESDLAPGVHAILFFSKVSSDCAHKVTKRYMYMYM